MNICERANDGTTDWKIEICRGNLANFKCSVDKFANIYFSGLSKIVDASLEYSEPEMNDNINQRSETGVRACDLDKILCFHQLPGTIY